MHEHRKRSASAVQAISAASEAARLAASIRSRSTQKITLDDPDKMLAAGLIREPVESVIEEEKHEVLHAVEPEIARNSIVGKVEVFSREAHLINQE